MLLCCILISFGCSKTNQTDTKSEVNETIKEDPLQKQAAGNLRKILADVWSLMSDGEFDDIYTPPTPESPRKEKKPLLSWRVELLKVTEPKLYKKFKLNEPWDSPTNKALIENIPDLFKPVRGSVPIGETYIQAFRTKYPEKGPQSILGSKIAFVNLKHGTSNTVLLCEGRKSVIWTKPDDIPFDPNADPEIGGQFDGDFNIGLCDCSTKFFSRKTPPGLLKVLITCNGPFIPVWEELKPFILSPEN